MQNIVINQLVFRNILKSTVSNTKLRIVFTKVYFCYVPEIIVFVDDENLKRIYYFTQTFTTEKLLVIYSYVLK